jgi:hypothetical protein
LSDDLRAQILIGDDAETFVSSELGRTVLGMAEQDLKSAIIAFDAADTTDHRQIAKIQQDVRTARRFESYLVELITRGREALHALKGQEPHES